MFSDKEYKDWMPLCSRPECSHRDYNCNACLEGENGIIWIYGRYIYYCVENETDLENDSPVICFPQLWRMKLDGSDHECVYKGGPVDLEAGEGYSGLSWGMSHQFDGDRLYIKIAFQPHNGDSAIGEETTIFCLFCLDLDDPTEPRRMSFTDENGESYENLFFSASDGKYLYATAPAEILGYKTVTEVYGETEIEMERPIFANSVIMRLDPETLKAERLCELPCYCSGIYTLYNGRLYFPLGYDAGMLFSVDTATGEVQMLNTCEPGVQCWQVFHDGRVLGVRTSYLEGEPGTFIFDENGEITQTVPFEAYGEDVKFYFITGHYAFGYKGTNDIRDTKTMQYPGKNPPNWYLDLNDIGTDELMWKKWEP